MSSPWGDYQFNGTTSIIIDITKKVQQEATEDRWNAVAATQEALKGLGRFFYLVDPSESAFSSPDQVPNYFRNAWPYFVLFILAENIVLWLERHHHDHDDPSGKERSKMHVNTGPSAAAPARLNDSVTSISHGLMQECGRILFRGAESAVYLWIHKHFRIVDLPWDSPLTWYFTALAIDFCYYWVHRASHEVHVLWAQHQVHHSSEEFNLTVGLRQSAMQGWCGFVFYLPLAIIVPPAHFLTHQHFSVLYQFWMHTKAVRSLGPLELILNTPKHHRVHHGSNLYCLDKNYGGFLIIWDRMFGTFAEEKPNEEIIYGLVYNQPSFNPLHLQWFYTRYVITRFQESVGWRNKLASVFYGPSWTPGAPRLGREEDKIEVKPRPKYDVILPLWMNLYLLAHFSLVLYGFQELTIQHMGMAPLSVLCWVIYVLVSITSIGLLFDGQPYACALESVRCAAFAIWLKHQEEQPLEWLFMLSGIFWAIQTFRTFNIKIKM